MAVDILELPSPGKLNLFLRITGRRDDGYHLLQTLFVLMEHGDTITLEKLPGPVIELSTQLPGVAASDNLALRAAQRLQEHCGHGEGARIGIVKRLPMGGGLGGGSSNAATVLLGLNQLWSTGLDLQALAGLGLQLGADVPVFVRGRSSLGTGVGEQLQPLHTGPAWFVVLVPQVNISTVSIFSRPELTRGSHPIRIPAFFGSAREPVPLANWPRGTGLAERELCNDCEPVVRTLYPEVDHAIRQLGRFGDARLTGTGGCVFACFESKLQAEEALQAMPPELPGFVSAACDVSPVQRALSQQH